MRLPFGCQRCGRMVFRGHLEAGSPDRWWHHECWALVDEGGDPRRYAVSDGEMQELFERLSERELDRGA